MSRVQQACPICGRPLQIAAEHAGLLVVCQHCGGTLRAARVGRSHGRPDSGGWPLAKRIERLLAWRTPGAISGVR